MKKQKDISKAQTEEPPPLPVKEAKQFSGVFMDMMRSYAYETLREFLSGSQVRPEALELLEDLFIIGEIREIYQQGETVSVIWNEEACEVVANISRLVPRLGGMFMLPTGDRIVGNAE